MYFGTLAQRAIIPMALKSKIQNSGESVTALRDVSLPLVACSVIRLPFSEIGMPADREDSTAKFEGATESEGTSVCLHFTRASAGGGKFLPR